MKHKKTHYSLVVRFWFQICYNINMRITVTNTATKLKDLIANGEEAEVRAIKRNTSRFTVLLQNTSEADVYFDTSDDANATDGGVLAFGSQMSIDIYSLNDLNLFAEADTDIKVVIL